MIDLLLKLLNMSISASWLVLAVIMLRMLFRKAPKWISCFLWGIVALRLLIPFSFESALSMIPSAEVIPQNIVTSQTPAIYSGISAVNSAVNPVFTQYLTPEKHTLETILSFAAAVWMAGAAALLLYSAVSSWKLHRQVRVSIQVQGNLYACDNVESPFIFGVLFPRIYIPSCMDHGQLQYVLAHENAHIRRRDHWWKPLGFLLLTVYWFNPLLWLAYILLCRDIEQACDEKVITNMDNAGKKGYSEALIACSVHRRTVMACPVAFGEVSVKSRIKGILSYRKPSFWILLAAMVACTITAVCFLTDPIPCTHAYTGEITTSSTCTEKGVQTLTCTQCNHSYTVHTDLLAHTYVPGHVLTEPDCTHTGSRELICADCGKVKTEVMEKTGHTFGLPFLTKAPNCVEMGEMSAECTLCHMVHAVETIASNQDHDLHETLVTEATCEAPGEGIITCSRCDYKESCTYERIEHTYFVFSSIPGTCTREGAVTLVCTGCGGSYRYSLGYSSCQEWITINWKIYCASCGRVKNTGENDLGNPFSSYQSQQPQFPQIQWDLSGTITPKP